MGAWFIRDQVKPFHPGCSYATLCQLIRRGRVKPETVLRGPTTRQFWSFAHSTPGVAHLLGKCHACGYEADPGQSECRACGVSFLVATDRQHLGLAPMHLLPGEAGADEIAHAAFGAVPQSDVSDPDEPVRNGSAGPSLATRIESQDSSPIEDAALSPSNAPARARRKQSISAAWITDGAALLLGAIAITVLLVLQSGGVGQSSTGAVEQTQTSAAASPNRTSLTAPRPETAPADEDGSKEPSRSGATNSPVPADEASESAASQEPAELSEQIESPGSLEPVRSPEEAVGPRADRESLAVPDAWRQAMASLTVQAFEGAQAEITGLDPELAASLERRIIQLRLRDTFGVEIRF
ncbi:MAG: hypothetical protein AAGH71_03475 [Planctomycetota bacterium]